MQPRAVVVRVRNKRGTLVHRSIHRFEEDMHLTPFRELVKKVYPTSETFIINVKYPAEPDPKATRGKGQLWCPYCSAYRDFLLDAFIGNHRCEVCGISTKDFHIQTMNKLWPSMREDTKRKEKKK